MSLPSHSTLKHLMKNFILGAVVLISFLSLSAVASDCCETDNLQQVRIKKLAEHYKLSITHRNSTQEANASRFDISKNGKVLYTGLNDLQVTERLDLVVKRGDKTGVIDAVGQQTIPFIYESIHPYNDAFVVEKDRLFGLVNRQQQPITAIEYYFSSYTLSQLEERPQLPLIGYKKPTATTGGWGSMSSAGLPIIPFIYDELTKISSFSHDETTDFYKIKKDDYWGVIDYKGRLILPTNYQKINWFNAAETLFLVIKHNREFVTDVKEKVRINGDIEQVSFIDVKDEEVLSPYDNESHDGTIRPAIITMNGKYGLFDSSAQQKLPAEYEDLSYLYQDDLIAAKKNGLSGVVNAQGKVVIPLVYDDLETIWVDTESDQPRKISYFITKSGTKIFLD